VINDLTITSYGPYTPITLTGNNTTTFYGNVAFPSVSIPVTSYDPNANFNPEAWLRHRVSEICELARA
jgi:hypothetical protein